MGDLCDFLEAIEALARQVGDGFGERDRGIQRGGPLQAEILFGGCFTEENVHVVENFDVIAEKADGLKQNRLRA